MTGRILNIWAKELRDTVRDRKTLIHGIAIPLSIGIAYAVLNPLVAAFMESKAEKPIEVPVLGIENADGVFRDVCGRFGITLVPWEGDLEASVASGERPAGLVLPPGFSKRVAAEKEASLTLLTNSTAGGLFGGRFSVKRLELALLAYSQAVAVKRLSVRKVDPAILAPVTLDARDLSSPAQRAGLFAAFMLPLLVAIVAAQGGMFIAIDVTAGEKERGTLEALLATPASDAEIFLGKLSAVFTMTAAPVALTLAGFWIAGSLLPGSVTSGAALPAGVVAGSILLALPLALFLNVVLMIISIRTRTFKDAQSSLMPVVFCVTAAAMAAAFAPPQHPLMFLLPVYGTSAVVGSLALAGPMPEHAVILSVAGSVAASAAGIALGLRLFNRERLLYSA